MCPLYVQLCRFGVVWLGKGLLNPPEKHKQNYSLKSGLFNMVYLR